MFTTGCAPLRICSTADFVQYLCIWRTYIHISLKACRTWKRHRVVVAVVIVVAAAAVVGVELVAFAQDLKNDDVDDYIDDYTALKFLCFFFVLFPAVIQALVALIHDPEPDHPLRADLAEEYTKDKKKFMKNAEEYTRKFGENLKD